jgi:hypothetical protein
MRRVALMCVLTAVAVAEAQAPTAAQPTSSPTMSPPPRWRRRVGAVTCAPRSACLSGRGGVQPLRASAGEGKVRSVGPPVALLAVAWRPLWTLQLCRQSEP